MKFIDEIKEVFKKRKGNEPKKTACNESPLYTFYRSGPQYLSYLYPVNADVIEDEILNPNGIIGPKFYKDYDYEEDGVEQIYVTIEKLKDYDNEWFKMDINEEIYDHLVNDLLFLAEKHNKYGAYTLLGSLSKNSTESTNYFKKAAENGVPEGMTAYGMFLYLNHNVEEGWHWLKKGAEAGEKIGMLLAVISYQYGTLCEIDNDKAADIYRRMIELKTENRYYAYNNLGVMYIDANYFHTALRLFKEANKCKNEVMKELKDMSDLETLKNIEYCKKLLELPLEERRKRVVLQYHSHDLEYIFCTDFKSPQTATDVEDMKNTKSWQPKNMTYIEPSDIEEHKDYDALNSSDKKKININEDFIFPSISVELHTDKIFGNQKELIFLEKNVHLELNQYIQSNIAYLKSQFRKNGYVFVYLPAHSTDIQDRSDCIGSYLNEYNNHTVTDGEKYDMGPMFHERKRKESTYWSTLFAKEKLPDDCAGFLHYIPQPDNRNQKKKIYDYILFPFRPGTDWGKAFSCFLDYMATMPMITFDKGKKLPLGVTITIDEKYNIFLTDNESKIAEIKMPVLSKVLYFVFLKHAAGFTMKNLVDYKDELLDWYKKLSNRKNIDKSIDDMVNPTNNSANEKISRIRKAFEEALKGYTDNIDKFVPVGKKGEKYAVTFDRNRVIWK